MESQCVLIHLEMWQTLSKKHFEICWLDAGQGEQKCILELVSPPDKSIFICFS